MMTMLGQAGARLLGVGEGSEKRSPHCFLSSVRNGLE